MLRIQIDGVTATIVEQELLTAGRVGLECGFSFSGEWDGLFKTAVFEGNQTIDVALTGDTCIVPWEALEVEGFQLRVGVYGANGAGTIVIPTVWAKFNKIQSSAVPSGNSSATPSQNANAYAVETAEQALSVAQSVETRANNGEFDGYSPTIEVTEVSGGNQVAVTDKNGTTVFTVENGTDGVSPTVSVENYIEVGGGSGHTVTITDRTGAHTFDVPNGDPGEDGATVWRSTVAPTESTSGGVTTYSFDTSDLSGAAGLTPNVGDLVFYSYYYYEITAVQNGAATVDNGTSIRGGPDGQLWSTQDVYLLRQVLSHLKYDSDSAGVIAEALLTSLESTPENTGWSMAQINMLDSLLDHVKYTDEAGGVYADTLIDSLKGQLVELGGTATLSANGTYDISGYANAVVDTPTYPDVDEEEF